MCRSPDHPITPRRPDFCCKPFAAAACTQPPPLQQQATQSLQLSCTGGPGPDAGTDGGRTAQDGSRWRSSRLGGKAEKERVGRKRARTQQMHDTSLPGTEPHNFRGQCTFAEMSQYRRVHGGCLGVNPDRLRFTLSLPDMSSAPSNEVETKSGLVRPMFLCHGLRVVFP